MSLTLGCSASSSVAPRSVVAFGAVTSDIPSGLRCELKGEPRVVATHVFPGVGVKAVSKAGDVWLRYATKDTADTTVALAPDTLQTMRGEAPPRDGAFQRPADSVEMHMRDGTRLLAWTQGSADSGINHQPAPAVADGSSDPTLDLGYQGTAIGDPAVALTSTGNGVVAFIESNGAHFQLVAARVSCSSR